MNKNLIPGKPADIANFEKSVARIRKSYKDFKVPSRNTNEEVDLSEDSVLPYALTLATLLHPDHRDEALKFMDMVRSKLGKESALQVFTMAKNFRKGSAAVTTEGTSNNTRPQMLSRDENGRLTLNKSITTKESDDQLDEFLPAVASAIGTAGAALGRAAVQGAKTLGTAAVQGAKTLGGAAAQGVKNLGTGMANVAANLGGSQGVTGSIEKIQGDAVTIKNPDGSVITTKAADLAQDKSGKVILSKGAIGSTAAQAQQQQQKPLTPGTKVQVTNSVDLSNLKKLSGL